MRSLSLALVERERCRFTCRAHHPDLQQRDALGELRELLLGFALSLALHHGIDELGVAGARLVAVDVEVPLLNDARDAAMVTDQRRGVHGVVNNKCWANEVGNYIVLQQLLNQLAMDGLGIM